jgi:hypothetical protein
MFNHIRYSALPLRRLNFDPQEEKSPLPSMLSGGHLAVAWNNKDYALTGLGRTIVIDATHAKSNSSSEQLRNL